MLRLSESPGLFSQSSNLHGSRIPVRMHHMFLTLSVAPFQFFPRDDTGANQITPYCLHSLYTTKELEGALEII